MPHSRDWKLRISDIQLAITDIESFMINVESLDNFKNNKVVFYAVLKALEIIGEACHHVPIEVKEKYPDIPWAVIKDFRNHLAHEYFGVDESIVWDTIINDLPELKKALLKIT